MQCAFLGGDPNVHIPFFSDPEQAPERSSWTMVAKRSMQGDVNAATLEGLHDALGTREARDEPDATSFEACRIDGAVHPDDDDRLALQPRGRARCPRKRVGNGDNAQLDVW